MKSRQEKGVEEYSNIILKLSQKLDVTQASLLIMPDLDMQGEIEKEATYFEVNIDQSLMFYKILSCGHKARSRKVLNFNNFEFASPIL